MRTDLLKQLMLVTLAALMWACGKDDKEEEKVPLPTAFLELNAATDASLIFNGGAGEVTISLNVNREVEATASADWVTPTVTAGAGNTATLKITVAQSNAAKRRTATVTLATKLAEEGDRAATPLTIALEQGVYGLPEADLLNLVFDITGGPGSARDISPMENAVYDVLPYAGLDPDCSKVFPTVSMNSVYGRNAAHFSGSNTCNIDNRRGSCAYRVDIVDYSTHEAHYFPDNLANNTQIPFNALGQKMTTGSFSIEVIFSPEPCENGNGTLVGFTQSWGGSLGAGKVDDKFKAGFYLDTNEKSAPVSNITDPRSLDFVSQSDETAILEAGRYYHVVAVYDREGEKFSIYLDGVKGKDEVQLQAGYGMKQADPKSGSRDALAQWIAIGGDTRRSDPVVPSAHINSSWENWAEGVFTGEIVIARMYSKVLTAEEVKILYDYEKP
jgi:hypothetical protein